MSTSTNNTETLKVIAQEYIESVIKILKSGDATENTYYSTLESFLKKYASQVLGKKREVHAIPKKTEAGNPDFRVWDGNQVITGYIEAKKPTLKDLDQVEVSEQLKRYRKAFPNVILTNFFEFRLYRDGDLVQIVKIADPLYQLAKRTPPVENVETFAKLLEKYFSFSAPKIKTAKPLQLSLPKRPAF